jgi:hypothetical protein
MSSKNLEKILDVDKVKVLEVVVSVMEDELDTLHEKIKALEIRMGIQELLKERGET